MNHESLWKHQLFFKRSDIQRTKRETDLDPGFHLCFQVSIGNIYTENRNRNFLFFFFLIFIFTLFYFTILYWFCHTLTWIHHGCTCDPKHEPPSHLPPHNIPLGHPRAPAPSILYPVSEIDWWFDSYMIVYMFQCHSPKSSHPLPLPLSAKVHSTHLCLFCCLAYRVIIAIFLNSIYMCWYTVLVFFFLAYLTLYNQLQFHPSH